MLRMACEVAPPQPLQRNGGGPPAAGFPPRRPPSGDNGARNDRANGTQRGGNQLNWASRRPAGAKLLTFAGRRWAGLRG